MSEDSAFRAMGIYNWQEDFDFSANRDLLIQLVKQARIDPIKLAFRVEPEKSRTITARKNKGAEQIIRDAPHFIGFEFCRPIEGNFLNLETDMMLTVEIYARLFSITHIPEVMSISLAISHIQLLCQHITPQYGFSHVMGTSFEPIAFLNGAGTNQMTPAESRRASEVGHYVTGRNLGKPFDRLIDIFELNVLNPGHLTRLVFGQTLASWIRSSRRHGELLEINSKTAIWLVPDSLRPTVRSMFFNAGYLVVPV